ncbi:MAG: 1-acyl-sn-glycerol-3-phosphate acyltransferase [Anaerolineales bacterium]|nr:1-acyl-sn-glycerol-3-phosphate acyltransferase [Anaerolineales bacterium]
MKPIRKIPFEELQKRRPLRRFMQWLSKVAFWLLTDLEIEGMENFPPSGPLLIVGNHFSMVDVAAFVRTAPYPIEFIGGAKTPNAPPVMSLIPRLWGVLPVFRGTGSHFALREAEKVLNKNGVVAIFPEGGSHARQLRPARPGAAFLAAHSRALILPIGLVGMDEVFEHLARFKKAHIRIRVGKPFGPYEVTGRGRERRQQLDEIGDRIMREIAALIPEDKHGYLSEDAELRDRVIEYPWATRVEGQVEGTNIR